jgi:hypothetical protein
MAEFTLEQQTQRWEDQREIKNLMGKYANLILLNREGEIYDRFWSQSEDACLGFNDGYYVGAQAVAGYYKAAEERNLLVAKTLQAKFPEQLGDKSDEEIYGIGPFKVQPLYNPVIEVAADGKTAKGLWSCQGAHNEVGGAGPVANWTCGYFAADFVRTADGWKIWHLLYVNDVDCICGQSWGKPQQPYPDLPEFADVAAFSYPPYTVEKEVRPLYTPDRPLTLTPEIPVPYSTFAETFSYGI